MFCFLYFNACITWKLIQVRIEFVENSDTGNITLTFEDLRSSQKPDEKETEKKKKIENDFEQVLSWYQGDDYLLEWVDNGVYIKNREMFEKDGVLYFRFRGITKDFKSSFNEHEGLKVEGDKRNLTLDKDETIGIISDGKVIETDDQVIITWPKNQRVISWKMIMKTNDDPNIYPLIDHFRHWKNNQKSNIH